MDAKQLQRFRALLDEIAHEQQDHRLVDASARWAREHLIPGALAPRTIRAYERGRREIEQRWGDLSLADTDWHREAAEFVAWRGGAGETALKVLRQILRRAAEWGWRTGDHGLRPAMRRASYLPREESWDASQLRAFLSALAELDETDPCRVPARDVLRVLLWTGCRASEVAGLQPSEVAGGFLRLRWSKTGQRHVWLCPQAQVVLARQKPQYGLVFPGRKPGRPIGHKTLAVRFQQARDLARIRYGTPHTLRHSWATIAIRCGVPSLYVQRQLGHSTSYMTARYTHALSSDIASGVAQVSRFILGGKAGV